MVRQRPPKRLEAVAMEVWLELLDGNHTSSENAPPAIIIAALAHGARLREATVVKLAVYAIQLGVTKLEISGELMNPTLIEQLASALALTPTKLNRLKLSLHSRATPVAAVPHFICAFQHMLSLTYLKLTGCASDLLFAAIAEAQPPLHTLDVAFSIDITDLGIKNLLKCSNNKNTHTSREFHTPSNTLQKINLWETSITTMGCSYLLKHCPLLSNLSCRWTAEAIQLLYLQKSSSLNLTELIVLEEIVTGRLLESLALLCPHLNILTIRKPQDELLDLEYMLSSVPNLSELAIFQFNPANSKVIKISTCPQLTYLHLFPLTAPIVDLGELVSSCPLLIYLALDEVKAKLSEPVPEPPKHLKTLRIGTPRLPDYPLDPLIILWITQPMSLELLDIGYCSDFQEQHWISLIGEGAFSKIEDLRISGASQLTADLIEILLENSPNLCRISFKSLTQEHLAKVQDLKNTLNEQNLLLDIITYGHRH